MLGLLYSGNICKVSVLHRGDGRNDVKVSGISRNSRQIKEEVGSTNWAKTGPKAWE